MKTKRKENEERGRKLRKIESKKQQNSELY
jgi:hypothetical protein